MMGTSCFRAWVAAIGVVLATSPFVGAQQVSVSTPMHSIGDSFYENFGVDFGFSLPGGRGPGSRVVGYNGNGVTTPNIVFRQGGMNSAIPPFGGFDPGSQSHLGFARMNPGGGGFRLGMSFGKGNTRSLVTETPTLVVPNGYGGALFNGSIQPFVTGVSPVVGERVMDNAVTRAIQSGQLDLTFRESEREYVPRGPIESADSSAKYGDASVAAIKAARQAKLESKQRELEQLIHQGLAFEEQEDFLNARRTYRKAIKVCDDQAKKKWLRERLSFLFRR